MSADRIMNIQPMLESLEKEAGLYSTMLDLSARHLEVLDAGQSETALLQLVADKQAVMQEIEAVESRIRPLKEGWPRLRERVSEGQRQEAEERMRALRDAIKTLIDLESRWHDTVFARRQEVGVELKRLDQARKTGAAYRISEAGANPRYMDKSK